ncbi:hypothetical protein DFH27DRAFT_613094 [Peziza echinospora]|nr:hypothetical protein DFH27DRAFT_613094 [Peziza echinospora]
MPVTENANPDSNSTTPQVVVPERFTGYAAFSAHRPHLQVNGVGMSLRLLSPNVHDTTLTSLEICDLDTLNRNIIADNISTHSISSGWGPSIYPLVAGHEITGRAVRASTKVTSITPGDI